MPMEPPPRRQRQRPALRWHENRTHWFAADKTGFHMLHTLFQTSLQFPKFSALTNISSLTCWSMTGRPAARWR